MFEDASFQTNTFTYTRGGRLLLYTDGVMDPADSHYLSPILTDQYPYNKAKRQGYTIAESSKKCLSQKR
ncbi:hypothetical protein [Bacillus atrophaeus]|uniref:hypothetical protein n=1 Tax=Bacillus atrophaeus TaxID=1452 RepID=UPI002DB82215|nr:hypothetical protein [Bacillus atrophaeus]MEC0803029.1 SpoIIE family protein phosphatase [Bacillus atrophaeus]MEC0854777.1 SpoIIE family protein phosphatase [Bacillus atrophaeus]MEC0857979.1 SpoIIE family protein phosphatase [Bacillus atrophaeus]MEC0860334.1 SpoIIE family protein phosphatase [Bacillus atrophaeus]MEC0870386.1 SpoIIE family protein phosphatase [Bacillus atrophaeus]